MALRPKLRIKLLELLPVRKLPMPEQVDRLLKCRMLRELVDLDALIEKPSVLAVDIADRGLGSDYPLESLLGRGRVERRIRHSSLLLVDVSLAPAPQQQCHEKQYAGAGSQGDPKRPSWLHLFDLDEGFG